MDTTIGSRDSHDIYTIDTDGSNLTNITQSPQDFDGEPAWSPDGTTIAFLSQNDDFNTDDIFIINVDGSGLTRLTDAPNIDRSPAWQAILVIGKFLFIFFR